MTYRWTDPRGGGERTSVVAITAHGPYVLCQSADSAESPDTAAQLIATTLELQQPLIDKYTPTPVDQLAQLPIDPDGLLAHTVPPRWITKPSRTASMTSSGSAITKTIRPAPKRCSNPLGCNRRHTLAPPASIRPATPTQRVVSLPNWQLKRPTP